MRFSDFKIHQKIVVPFGLLLIAATVIPATVSVSLISRTLDSRVRKQVETASQIISETGLALNRPVLDNLKKIINADIVAYDEGGTTLVTTFTEDDPVFLHAIQDPDAAIRLATQPLVTRDIEFKGIPYRVAYRRIPARRDAIMAFVADVSDVAVAESEVSKAITLLAAGLIVVTFLISGLIARRFSAPLLDLVEFTKTVARGDLKQRIDVKSGDEIGKLAAAFNEMVKDLQASKEKILQSEKLAVAGMLAARVAHDVRNPLSSIKMQAQLLRGKVGPENQEMLRSMLREIDRVEWVVRGLLDLAKPEEISRTPADIHQVLDDVVALTDAQMRHRKITVTRNFRAVPASILLDVDRFKQALLNVLYNAAEAMHTGGTILITTRAESPELIVEICDEGEGLASGVLDKLFEPFVTTKREGVGLGLVNAKSVIERHGGTIRLEPRQGGGTRAIIRLPNERTGG